MEQQSIPVVIYCFACTWLIYKPILRVAKLLETKKESYSSHCFNSFEWISSDAPTSNVCLQESETKVGQNSLFRNRCYKELLVCCFQNVEKGVLLSGTLDCSFTYLCIMNYSTIKILECFWWAWLMKTIKHRNFLKKNSLRTGFSEIYFLSYYIPARTQYAIANMWGISKKYIYNVKSHIHIWTFIWNRWNVPALLSECRRISVSASFFAWQASVRG